MATLITSTTIPCDVISNSNIYHNSISNSSTYINNNNNNTLNTFTTKLRTSSIDANEVNKKVKDSNNSFVSNKSLSASDVLCKTSPIKHIEKPNRKISKGLVISNKNCKTMSNSDINEKNSTNKVKKVENKKNNTNSTNKNLTTSSTKKNNNNSNIGNSSLKSNGSKIKNKSNIKIATTKVINIQNLNAQNTQNPRIQTGNASRKIVNIRNTKKTSARPAITKLKLPTKDNSNAVSLSKLSLNHSYSNIKRGSDNCLDRCFSNYSYNPEFSKKYRVKEEMGRGGFGLVFVAERISDGVEVAVKFIIKDKVPVSAWVKDPELGIVPRECYLLKHVNHPCIIKFLDCYSDRKYFYLVMELHGTQWSKKNNYKSYQNENNNTTNKKYCSYINAAALKTNKKFQVGQVRPSMDLFECIEYYFECFDEPKARYIFVQLLTAIKYLNSLSIIHRDIKDENILIDKDLNIKLIDFGAAIQIKGGRVYDKFVGTIPYIAPEIIKGKEYGSLSQDIYSLGVLLHLLIYGDLPAIDLNTEDNTPLHLPQYTIKGNYCSEEVRHLIRWMLQKSPNARPSLDEIFNHDWIKNNQ